MRNSHGCSAVRALPLWPYPPLRWQTDFGCIWQHDDHLKTLSCGTELQVTREGVPDAIPQEACYLGWQGSLALLAKLVETELPG